MVLFERAKRGLAAAFAELLNSGAAPPRLAFYDGEQPPPDGAADQVVLALLYPPAFAADGNGTVTAWPTPPQNGLVSGMPVWARLSDGDGNAIANVDVGLPGSDADLILDYPIRVGEPVQITHFTIQF